MAENERVWPRGKARALDADQTVIADSLMASKPSYSDFHAGVAASHLLSLS
jgi:hypothetical protein